MDTPQFYDLEEHPDDMAALGLSKPVKSAEPKPPVQRRRPARELLQNAGSPYTAPPLRIIH